MHLLYLTFGDNQNVHSQAAFSICSFLKQEAFIHTINVITDRPTYYNHLQEKVNVITITAADLQSWEGAHRFFWRVKIKAIEKVCALYPGSPVVYLDTDTILTGNLDLLNTTLQHGKALMHQNEGPLATKKSKTEKKMWQQLKGKNYGGLLMQPTDCMWNAGVVATPNTQNNQENTLALSICDEMCQQGVTRRLIEQYALSLAYEQVYHLQEAQQNIAHYWSVKDIWNEKITAFFLQAYFAQLSLHQVIQQFDVQHFSDTPITQRNRNTNTRIKKWADRMFPPKDKFFIK